MLIEIRLNCPSPRVAEEIAGALLERGLVAAANRMPPVVSHYRWQGETVMRYETPLLLRTRAERFEAVADAVRALHPYEVPGLAASELVEITQEYAEWILSVTA